MVTNNDASKPDIETDVDLDLDLDILDDDYPLVNGLSLSDHERSSGLPSKDILLARQADSMMKRLAYVDIAKIRKLVVDRSQSQSDTKPQLTFQAFKNAQSLYGNAGSLAGRMKREKAPVIPIDPARYEQCSRARTDRRIRYILR